MLDTPARRILGAGAVSFPPPPHTPRKESVESLQERLDGEISRRKTLQETYDNLDKFQKQQSVQLDILRKSRQDMEEEVAKKEAELKQEKEARFQDRMQWKPKLDLLQDENEHLKQELEEVKRLNHQLKKKDLPEAIQKVNNLEAKVAEKDKQLQDKDEQHLAAMQTERERVEATENDLRQELANKTAEVSSVITAMGIVYWLAFFFHSFTVCTLATLGTAGCCQRQSCHHTRQAF